MAPFPKRVFEASMACGAGEVLVIALGNAGVVEEPPQSRAGWFPDFARETRKYEPGTAFTVLGTLVDVGKQRFDVPVLFYDGPPREPGGDDARRAPRGPEAGDRHCP